MNKPPGLCLREERRKEVVQIREVEKAPGVLMKKKDEQRKRSGGRKLERKDF